MQLKVTFLGLGLSFPDCPPPPRQAGLHAHIWAYSLPVDFSYFPETPPPPPLVFVEGSLSGFAVASCKQGVGRARQ